MSNKIFVIKKADDGIIALYTNLEKAKNEVKKIYEKTHYCYEIHVYILVDTEYIITNLHYIYCFDNFSRVFGNKLHFDVAYESDGDENGDGR